MKAVLDTSKIVLAATVLTVLISGCDKRPATDQTPAATIGNPDSTTIAPSDTTVIPVVPAPVVPAESSATVPGEMTPSTNASVGMPDPAPVSEAATQAGAAVAGAANSVGTVVEDSVITTKLKTAVLADTTLKDSDISVETKNGTVMLTGSVINDAQKNHVAMIAQALEGVKNVDNKLVIVAK